MCLFLTENTVITSFRPTQESPRRIVRFSQVIKIFYDNWLNNLISINHNFWLKEKKTKKIIQTKDSVLAIFVLYLTRN